MPQMKSNLTVLVPFAACLTLFVGCGDDSPPPGGTDASTQMDGGTSEDASTPQDGSVNNDATTPVDTGVPPVQDECDPVQQTCTSTGTRCQIENDLPRGGTTCVPTTPNDKELGERCGGGECEAGLVCITDTGTTSASCRAVCDPATGSGCENLPTDADCLQTIRDTNWGLCVELPAECDGVTQAPCEADEACQPLRRFDGTFEMRCQTAGTGMHGDTCNPARCARGLVCVNQDNATLCRTICDDDMDCPMGSTCNGAINGLNTKYCTP